MENQNQSSQSTPSQTYPLLFGQRLRTVTIISLIAGLLFTGILFASLSKFSQKQITPQPSPSLITALSPTASDAYGANWKTYKNVKYGFELHYPNDWNGGSVDSEKPIAVFSNNSIIININRHNLSELPKGYKNVKDWFSDLKMKKQKAVEPNDGLYYGPGSDNPYQWYMYYRLDNIIESTINQYSALVTSNPNTSHTYVIIPSQQFIFELTIEPLREYNNPVVDQILSTFKFLDIPETGPETFCTSNKDCWCRAFTGAQFIPGEKVPHVCNLKTNRCAQCYYE